MSTKTINDLTALCKRRGFIFQNSEIYGGLPGVYDYGPLGIEIKNNLKAAWWKANIYERDDIVGIDTAILSHKSIFNYSGHEDTFADLMIDCYDCHHRWRFDSNHDGKCANCGSTSLTAPRNFNLMFKTNIGSRDDNNSFIYLRPETAQGIFTNFKNLTDTTFSKLPFGIAQIGKAFRNEISPGNFIFRLREFEQMEIEFFVEPDEDNIWHEKWVELRYDWWIKQGLSKNNLKINEQKKSELAHYAKRTIDLLYNFLHGFEEIEGIANRTNYDLGSHSRSQSEFCLNAKVKLNTESNTKLSIYSEKLGRSILPYVIEPSAGVDRGVLAILTEAYQEEVMHSGKKRIVLKLKPQLAPIKVAIIPLARNNNDIIQIAQAIKKDIQSLGIGRVLFEDGGNIGKAYRKHDEIGTPWCITIDYETLSSATASETVTVRERDTMQQTKVNSANIMNYIKTLLNN